MRRRENLHRSKSVRTEIDIIPQVYLREDGILYIDFSRYDRITLASLQYVHSEHIKLCPVGKVPVLVKGNSVGSIEYAAQRYAASPEVCAGICASALVVSSFLERHLARMFLVYHRPPYSVQVFSNEQDAIPWLRGFCLQPK